MLGKRKLKRVGWVSRLIRLASVFVVERNVTMTSFCNATESRGESQCAQ